MQSISNDRYDAILRLLSEYLDEDKEQTAHAAERRRKAAKTIKYLKRKRQ